jgi:2-haloacid dehalogenase
MKTSQRPPIRVVVFDAYGTLFDVYSIGVLAEQMFPGKGDALTRLWRERQIDYTRLRTLSNRYQPFDVVTRDALRWTAEALGLALTEAAETQLMARYAQLSAHAEALDALRALKAMDMRLAILSNGTPAMLDVLVEHTGMQGMFECVLSVDAAGQYKTAAAAYQLAPDAFGLPAREMLFVSSNGWDACGAAWFGYTTIWINRSGLPAERLGVTPDATGDSLHEVVRFITART